AYERLRARQPAAVASQESAGNGGGSVAGTPPVAEGEWRLRGVVQVSGQRYALIEMAAGKTRRFREGELLPRGEKLLAVRRDRIEISRPDAAEAILLYQRRPDTKK
ncbi:MAG: hypothetical protein WAV07_02940, partial [Candidatus Contendobacter sp.]